MSSIVGIGLDVVELARIERVLELHGQRFRTRVFTAAEQDYCERQAQPLPSYAARWAAKEAVSKALGTGIGEYCAFVDVEVLRGERGVPSIALHGAAHSTAEQLGIAQFLISLTHAKEYAAAQAIALSRG